MFPLKRALYQISLILTKFIYFTETTTRKLFLIYFHKLSITIYLEPAGLGNYYGTLCGPISHFSTIPRTVKKSDPIKRNMITNPSKKAC